MKPAKATTKPKTRVFLAEDHPIVRRGLQMVIGLEPDLTICGQADGGPTALEQILALKPDVVVVDLALKVGSGLDLVKQVRAQCPDLKLLVFSMRDEAIYAERALRAGASGYLAKEEGAEKVVEAIRSILRGGRYVSERVAAHLVGQAVDGGSPSATSQRPLSDRELEVLELLGTGLGSREIATKLGVSVKTVESHREHLKEKLGLTRATELVSYAFHWVKERGGQ